MKRLRPEYDPLRFLATTDARYREVRDFKRRMTTVEADLGGAQALSYMQRSIAQRATFLEMLIEGMEGRLAMGQPANIVEYLAAINTLRQLWLALGLKRQSRELTLSDYLNGKGGDDDAD